MPDGYDQAAAQRIDVYRQAYALIEALWQPLVARGLINEKGPGPAKLSDWIKVHIGPSFPQTDAKPIRAYSAYHPWSDYQRGEFDAYFWGSDGSTQTDGEPSFGRDKNSIDGSAEEAGPGLAQLLPQELFDKLCCMLSTTNDARIPQHPYQRNDDVHEGLWFYGLHQFDGVDSDKQTLTDQHCQRGIGPNGELILRSRPFGAFALVARDLGEYRARNYDKKELFAEETTADNLIYKRLAFIALYTKSWKDSHLNELRFWKAQYQDNRLDTLLDARRLGSRSSTNDDMQTSLRQALDLAVCLPYAIVREVEKQLGERLGATRLCEELQSVLLRAEVRTPQTAPRSGDPLFTNSEQSRLAGIRTWPGTARGIAATATCAIVRLLLNDAHTAFDALFRHFDHVEPGGMRAIADREYAYLEELAAWGDAFDMRDDPSGAAATYEDVYVSPTFERAVPKQRHARINEAEEANPACIVARARGRVRLLVQAGSGMGKTTFVKGLAAGIARAQTEGDITLLNAVASHDYHTAGIEELIPVLITQPRAERAGLGFDLLKRETPPTVEAFAELLFRQLPAATFQDPFMAAANDDEDEALAFFKHLLSSPRALVIIDSIDEVPLAVRDQYIDCIKNLAHSYGIQRLIVTSRPLSTASEGALEEAVGDNVVRLLPFDLPRQRELFENLVRLYTDEEGRVDSGQGDHVQNLAEDLFQRVTATPGFKTVLENPLMATALVRALMRAEHPTSYQTLRTLTDLLPKLYKRDAYDDILLARMAFDSARDGTDSLKSIEEFEQTYENYREELRSDISHGAAGNEPNDEGLIDRMVTRRGILTMRDRELEFEHTIVCAFFAAQHVINTLLQVGGSETHDEEKLEDAKNLSRKLVFAAFRTSRTGAAFLAVLILLSAQIGYGERRVNDMREDIYFTLATYALLSWGEELPRHDCAVDLFRASHTFDFGRPCPRSDKVFAWESRLVELASLVAPPSDGPASQADPQAAIADTVHQASERNA